MNVKLDMPVVHCATLPNPIMHADPITPPPTTSPIPYFKQLKEQTHQIAK